MPEGVVISYRQGFASVLVDGAFALFMVSDVEAEAYVANLSRELASIEAAAPALQAAA